MKILLSLNKRRAIVWCHTSTSKTSLFLECGLIGSGTIVRITKCDQIERDFWTKSGSLGKMTPSAPCTKTTSYGISNIKLLEYKKKRLVIVTYNTSVQDTPTTKCYQTKRNFWKFGR
jgi:hypothetical protein